MSDESPRVFPVSSVATLGTRAHDLPPPPPIPHEPHSPPPPPRPDVPPPEVQDPPPHEHPVPIDEPPSAPPAIALDPERIRHAQQPLERQA